MSTSRVLYFRHLPDSATDAEINASCAPFGVVTNILKLLNKKEAFVEFATLQSAEMFVNHTGGNAIVRGKHVKVVYSDRQNLTLRTDLHDAPPNNILFVLVTLLLHPVDVDTLYQVFSMAGRVRKVAMSPKNGQIQGFVEMETVQEAAMAKEQFNGKHIFTTSCHMQIQFSRLTSIDAKLCAKDYTVDDQPLQDVPQAHGALGYPAYAMTTPGPPVQVVTTAAAMRKLRAELPGTVGLVPTMGCLHEAHMALLRLCAAHCSHVVVTIFVNPAQFAPSEDFDSYPRQLEVDIKLIEAEGLPSVAVFCPPQEEIYPDHCPAHPTLPQTTFPAAYVDVERYVAGKAEAEARPGFFSGVATVCVKLFNLTTPHIAVFGKKDRLQCYVVRQAVRDLCLPVAIVEGETLRAPSGLALSSRNRYLSDAQRHAAAAIYAALQAGQGRCGAGQRVVGDLCYHVRGLLSAQPDFEVSYVVVSTREDMRDLEEGDIVPPEGAVLSCAVRLGPARLIDNVDLF